MTATIIAPPLAGHVLASTADGFVVAEWQDAGGPAGPPRFIAPLHLHHADDEVWYVIEGNLRVRSGEDEIEALAGPGVFGPRGDPPNHRNLGPGRDRYLLIKRAHILALITEIH